MLMATMLIFSVVSFETEFCQSLPCQNGATCHSQWDDYWCECSRGYTGKNCETPCKYIWSTTLRVRFIYSLTRTCSELWPCFRVSHDAFLLKFPLILNNGLSTHNMQRRTLANSMLGLSKLN